MSVKLTSEAEKERLANRSKPTWGLYSDISLVRVLHEAKKLGWKENKVQVRFENIATDVVEYTIEPYEQGCGCAGLLKYADYFD